ncbi:IclR family transcriptional regulator [Kineosporia babensis]|uniref:IclR family transcriptional regulator n=1 Tax=Kineosporia babensis TaxID=499548 RepID=A0A9X1NJQ7_9ACTN|nr:IclR family transcriptional regulator [Kineosporia babensis]MCD5314451.1 IclR family transcriptional regulator [Kineosporia babensis]
MAEASGTEAAGRVADVLLLFADGPQSLGVTEVARQLDLSKAVVHRILTTLVDRHLLATDPGVRGYRLGSGAAALGARALRESRLRAEAMPVLRELSQVTGETATVSARVADGRVYLDQIESSQEIKMTVEVGRRYPLHAGSSSNCILAFLAEREREDILTAEFTALTDRTILDADTLRERLTQIREQGYATSASERQLGAGAVAAPVFGVDGSVIGSISVCGPTPRVDDETRQKLAPLVRTAADTISRRLGWRGGLPA